MQTSLKQLTISIALCVTLLFVTPTDAEEINVLKTGLGTGSVNSLSPGIACGSTCDFNFTSLTATLRATAGAESVFVKWEGSGINCPGTGDCVVDLSISRSVRAEFNLVLPRVELEACREAALPPNDCAPTDIDDFLTLNPQIDTAVKFVAALPLIYRENWILMTRSESLQTGTALSPRILLPSPDARFVFSIGMVEHASFPGSHPDAVEYMQYDETQKNFRFHEIVLRKIDDMHIVGSNVTFPERDPAVMGKKVIEDDPKCTKCHSTQNVPNTSPAFGTAPRTATRGESTAKNKPNWDAYDSWAGMMPFNRDRIYEDSVDEAAFEHLFNLWNWRGSDRNDSIRQIIELLELQPTIMPASGRHTITKNLDETTNDAHIEFGYEKAGTPAAPSAGPVPNQTNYAFDNVPVPTSPVDGTTVNQEGHYVTLRHSTRAGSLSNEDYLSPGSDEGRGVRFFDLLGGFGNSGVNLNALRIADELINHRYGTSDFPIDVRPVALAILQGYITIDGANEISPPIATNHDFFLTRNGLTHTGYNDIGDLVADTRARAKSLPRRKADLQKLNLDRYMPDGTDDGAEKDPDPYLATSNLGTIDANGLIQEYSPSLGATLDKRQEEVFRRKIDLGERDEAGMGRVMVDRENYDLGQNNTKVITLLRYFLEPLGISVDKWSMGVRGRSRAYNMADVFSRYTSTIAQKLVEDLEGARPPSGFTDAAGTNPFTATQANVMTAVAQSLAAFRLPDPANEIDNVPTFTAIQRIFNKSCIECHGGLNYPPYYNHGYSLDFSENEEPPVPPPIDPMWNRLESSYAAATSYTSPFVNENADGSFDDDDDGIMDAGGGFLYEKVARLANEDCPHDAINVTYGLMPCGGPSLSQTDVKTIERWIKGSAPHTAGDPHIRTIGGVSYDFQAAGEFVLLTGPGVEVQARQTAIQGTAPYGPNGHTGLTSCVSVNSAAAVRIGQNRITYQGGLGVRQSEHQLELRIDGKLWRLGSQTIPLSSGGQITRTSAANGIQLVAPGGTKVVVTPNWWSSQQLWVMTIDLYHARGTRGIMGNIAPDNWLPALPDGTLLGRRPKNLEQRYQDLYTVFGEAWRVTDTSTLFDYAPGTSTANYTFPGWPNGESAVSCFLPPQNPNVDPAPPLITPISVAQAESLCAAVEDAVLKDNCIGDVAVTGEAEFAQIYLSSQKIRNNSLPVIPRLEYPPDNSTLAPGQIDFRWHESRDLDGDKVSYRHCIWSGNRLLNSNECRTVSTASNDSGTPLDAQYKWWTLLLYVLLLLTLIVVALRKIHTVLTIIAIGLVILLIIIFIQPGRNNSGIVVTQAAEELRSGEMYYWKVVAEDEAGGIVESKTRRLRIE